MAVGVTYSGDNGLISSFNTDSEAEIAIQLGQVSSYIEKELESTRRMTPNAVPQTAQTPHKATGSKYWSQPKIAEHGGVNAPMTSEEAESVKAANAQRRGSPHWSNPPSGANRAPANPGATADIEVVTDVIYDAKSHQLKKRITRFKIVNGQLKGVGGASDKVIATAVEDTNHEDKS